MNINKKLVFIATNDQAKRINSNFFPDSSEILSIRGLEIEMVSMKVVKNLCSEKGIEFVVLGIDDYILQYKSLSSFPVLFLEGDLEEILYEYLGLSDNIDGYTINKIIKDKYTVYKMISAVSEVKQPKTYIFHNLHELEQTIKLLDTQYIVLKPRKYSFSSNNILIINRTRFSELSSQEILNLHNYLVQEYIPETLWPPKEYRLHFVGRKLCRCLCILDKNNRNHAFSIMDLKIDNVPKNLMEQSKKISNILVNQTNKDNFTLDFLECKGGYIFLEANCGALGSFYVNTVEERVYLEPIFNEIFKRYFKIKSI